MLIEHYQFPESTGLPLSHTPECHKTNNNEFNWQITTQWKQYSHTKP
jgi:hypothetical protein